MNCVNCNANIETNIHNPLCIDCFINLICEDAANEHCEFIECEFYAECQNNNPKNT